MTRSHLAMIDDISIICRDQTQLAATLFTPSTPLQGAIMIAPATGIRRHFYRRFAQHLQTAGYAVITFDNRGIGDSLSGHVRHHSGSIIDWGRLDMPAVLNELQQRFPATNCHLVGHSAGGQLVGMMENGDQLSSMLNFACSSGSLRNMRPGYLLKAHFFMNVFIPVTAKLLGYTPSHWVGMGQPLPAKVARQWQKWCNGKGYIETEFGNEVSEHWYDSLTIPSLWLLATDDDIAVRENLNDMLRVYQQLPAQTIELNPQHLSLNSIGHMGFFQQHCSVLWDGAISWLQRRQWQH